MVRVRPLREFCPLWAYTRLQMFFAHVFDRFAKGSRLRTLPHSAMGTILATRHHRYMVTNGVALPIVAWLLCNCLCIAAARASPFPT